MVPDHSHPFLSTGSSSSITPGDVWQHWPGFSENPVTADLAFCFPDGDFPFTDSPAPTLTLPPSYKLPPALV